MGAGAIAGGTTEVPSSGPTAGAAAGPSAAAAVAARLCSARWCRWPRIARSAEFLRGVGANHNGVALGCRREGPAAKHKHGPRLALARHQLAHSPSKTKAHLRTGTATRPAPTRASALPAAFVPPRRASVCTFAYAVSWQAGWVAASLLVGLCCAAPCCPRACRSTASTSRRPTSGRWAACATGMLSRSHKMCTERAVCSAGGACELFAEAAAAAGVAAAAATEKRPRRSTDRCARGSKLHDTAADEEWAAGAARRLPSGSQRRAGGLRQDWCTIDAIPRRSHVVLSRLHHCKAKEGQNSAAWKPAPRALSWPPTGIDACIVTICLLWDGPKTLAAPPRDPWLSALRSERPAHSAALLGVRCAVRHVIKLIRCLVLATGAAAAAAGAAPACSASPPRPAIGLYPAPAQPGAGRPR